MSEYSNLRTQIFDKLGWSCPCGQTDPRALQIDHRYGDGADERRDYKGVAYLRHILANVDSGRYQILCASCNSIKRVALFEYRRFKLEVIDDLTTLASEYNPDPP